MEYYKSEHNKLLREAATLVEATLWRESLDGTEETIPEQEGAKTTRGQRMRARMENRQAKRITSGASIVAFSQIGVNTQII